MIDSASQVLLSLSKPSNTGDRSSSGRNASDMGPSFSDTYDQSKLIVAKRKNNYSADNDSVQQRDINKRSQLKNADQDNTQASSRINDRNDGKRLSENESRLRETNKKTSTDSIDNDKNRNTATDVARVNKNDADKLEVKNELNKKIENKLAQVSDEAAVDDAKDNVNDAGLINDLGRQIENELKSKITGDLAEIDGELSEASLANINSDVSDVYSGLGLDGEQVENAQLALLTVSIEKDLIAVTDEIKGAVTGENDDSVGVLTLSRAEVLAGIEKILNKDKLIEQDVADKLLKPDAAINANASKILADKANLKDFNILTQNAKEQALLSEAEGDELISSTESTDALLEKIIERLDFSKVKGELAYQEKMMTEKTSISEFVDQLTAKMSNEISGGALLPQVGSLAARTAIVSAAPTQQLTMTTSFNQPEWGADFSKRIQFMVGNDIKNVELRLDPPELGRINIKINMMQDQAAISFTSAHGNVREAIENTLPRLREMLQESGIQLSDANVNEGKQQDAHQAEQDSNLMAPAFPSLAEDDETELISKPMASYSADGMIDYFA